jgi:uridine phosphorylase
VVLPLPEAYIPLVEGNPADRAIVHPEDIFLARGTSGELPKLPERGILSFSYIKANQFLAQNCAFQRIPFFEDPRVVGTVMVDGTALLYADCPIGAPGAAILIEELHYLGLQQFVLVGAAGVLDASIARGDAVVVEKALRDEGTSYHYLLPSRWASADDLLTEHLKLCLQERGIGFIVASSWTTDAPYRETFNKIATYRDLGVATVEMEAAALFAVSKYLGIRASALLSGGDSVAGGKWDSRRNGDDQQVLEKRQQLILAACCAIASFYVD